MKTIDKIEFGKPHHFEDGVKRMPLFEGPGYGITFVESFDRKEPIKVCIIKPWQLYLTGKSLDNLPVLEIKGEIHSYVCEPNYRFSVNDLETKYEDLVNRANGGFS